MNIATQGSDEYYVAGALKGFGGAYYVVSGACLHGDGSLRASGGSWKVATEDEARAKLRSLEKTKIKRKGHKPTALHELPLKAMEHLKMEEGDRMTPDEMLEMLHHAAQERYVYFRDCTGIEEYFDAGVEYLGVMGDEDGVVYVYDRFGDKRGCMVSRFERIELTERAKKVSGGV